MDNYEQIGPYILSIDKSQDIWRGTLGTSRQFIWTRYMKHQRAFVKITFVNIEGQANALEFFIQPDDRGSWRVSIEETSETGYRVNGTYKITKSEYQSNC